MAAGDPTVFGPSLSSASDTSAVLPADVGAPRNFMAPHTYDELSCQTGTLNMHRPRLLRPDLELRQGLTFHLPHALP
jgi:hypothetical protein